MQMPIHIKKKQQKIINNITTIETRIKESINYKDITSTVGLKDKIGTISQKLQKNNRKMTTKGSGKNL